MKKKMTKAQMRIAIIKDAIKQIKAEKYFLSHSYYLTPRDHNQSISIDKSLLEKEDTKCNVCAAGSLLASGIRLFNGFSVTLPFGEKFIPIENIFEGLKKWFTESQIAMIEIAFEERTSAPLTEEFCQCSDELKGKAYNFSKVVLFYNSTERALAILNNMLKNKGTFKP